MGFARKMRKIKTDLDVFYTFVFVSLWLRAVFFYDGGALVRQSVVADRRSAATALTYQPGGIHHVVEVASPTSVPYVAENGL